MTGLDGELVVLHALAVVKLAGADALAAGTGVDVGAVRATLERAAGDGRATEARGAMLLTAEGRAWLDAEYPAACAELRADDALAGAYERFETVNAQALEVFTRWQTVPVAGGGSVPNDHADTEYDNRIVDELGAVDDAVQPILERFAAADPRYAIYARRLADAYDRVLAGEADYVSATRIDSYHTVWFQLHEDILRVLGRARRES